MEARVFGRRERWAVGMGLRGVLGRLSMTRSAATAASVWEACDARGEGIEFRRVDGAVMLRDEECAPMTGVVSSPLGVEKQQPCVSSC